MKRPDRRIVMTLASLLVALQLARIALVLGGVHSLVESAVLPAASVVVIAALIGLHLPLLRRRR